MGHFVDLANRIELVEIIKTDTYFEKQIIIEKQKVNITQSHKILS